MLERVSILLADLLALHSLRGTVNSRLAHLLQGYEKANTSYRPTVALWLLPASAIEEKIAGFTDQFNSTSLVLVRSHN